MQPVNQRQAISTHIKPAFSYPNLTTEAVYPTTPTVFCLDPRFQPRRVHRARSSTRLRASLFTTSRSTSTMPWSDASYNYYSGPSEVHTDDSRKCQVEGCNKKHAFSRPDGDKKVYSKYCSNRASAHLPSNRSPQLTHARHLREDVPRRGGLPLQTPQGLERAILLSP